MQGTNRSGERGEKSLLRDPGSELRLGVGGRENKRGEYHKWDGKEKKKEYVTVSIWYTADNQCTYTRHADDHQCMAYCNVDYY